MTKPYVTCPAIPGYGARITLKHEDLTNDVDQFLKRASVWNGADKRTRDTVSWEFTPFYFNIAKIFLDGNGFAELRPENAMDWR